MVWETRVQSQVESYQRLKKWYLMLPCLTLNIIRYGSRVKWSNLGNGVAPSPTLVAIEKGASESPSTKVTNFTYLFWLWFFRLLSSSLLLLVETRFSCCILRPYSGLPCLSGHRDDSTWKIIFKDFFFFPRLNHFYAQINRGLLRIQWLKRVSTNNNIDEDSCSKNHNQKINIKPHLKNSDKELKSNILSLPKF